MRLSLFGGHIVVNWPVGLGFLIDTGRKRAHFWGITFGENFIGVARFEKTQ